MSAITQLYGKLRAKNFSPGDLLIEEGGAKGRLYVLESGELAIIRDGVEVAAVSDHGALVGEISALLDSPPSATVKAKTNVRAYIVPNPVGRLLDDPALLLHVARLLAHRLTETTAYLAASKQRTKAKVAALLREL
jgi:CRP/FNR family cyclic AMP-dependent transcriptional regulator